MKTYEIFESETGVVILSTEGNHQVWIPNDPANRHYAEYLRYTEWVEAGNKPKDFWTQNESEI
jgi:frataxin-like iron-binding protein CyaY